MMPTRNRPTGAPTSSRYGRTGGGATTGSPGSAPAATSSIAAQSRTERVTANCTLRKRLSSPNAGPIDTRPRDVFSPTSPHALAGRRIEPPPSLACATGTSPAATAAADPPLDPAGLRFGSQGLRVGPNDTGSVVAVNPSSGVLVRPTTTKPASR